MNPGIFGFPPGVNSVGGSIPFWEAGKAVAQWVYRKSPLNGELYQSLTSLASPTVDPSLDYVNWRVARDSRPLRVTRLTSGVGTFIPLYDNSVCRVTLQGGGSSGARVNAGSAAPGGAAGATTFLTITVPIAGVPYQVGGGGASVTSGIAAGNAGTRTKFAGVVAEGGLAPSTTAGGFGGDVGFMATSGDGLGCPISICGGGGADGGAGKGSRAAGFRPNSNALSNGVANSAFGNGSGGNSVLALGGQAQANAVAGVAGTRGSGGSGASGAASGAGGGGEIIIEEY